MTEGVGGTQRPGNQQARAFKREGLSSSLRKSPFLLEGKWRVQLLAPDPDPKPKAAGRQDPSEHFLLTANEFAICVTSPPPPHRGEGAPGGQLQDSSYTPTIMTDFNTEN